MNALPIDDALPDLIRALQARGVAVLQAPPGAGKTTRVPLALLDQIKGKIVMLEPRRLAARGRQSVWRKLWARRSARRWAIGSGGSSGQGGGLKSSPKVS